MTLLERRNELSRLIKSGGIDIDEATKIINGSDGYQEAEVFAATVLREDEPNIDLVNRALEVFLNSRENEYEKHGYWVHSLSHFTEKLWKHRLLDWIKKFNQVAFRGAIETGDNNCCNRLVSDFSYYALWSDDSADFFLTPEYLTWADSDDLSWASPRINVGKFDSEEDWLRWELRRPKFHTDWDSDAQRNLIDVEKIKSFLSRLLELGVDTKEFEGLLNRLLSEQLATLNSEIPSATEDYQKERLSSGIETTKKQLAELS